MRPLRRRMGEGFASSAMLTRGNPEDFSRSEVVGGEQEPELGVSATVQGDATAKRRPLPAPGQAFGYRDARTPEMTASGACSRSSRTGRSIRVRRGIPPPPLPRCPNGDRVFIAIVLVLLVVALGSAPVLSAEWQLDQEYRRDTGTPAFSLVSKSVTGDRPLSLHLVLPDPKHTRLVVVDNPGNGRRIDQAMVERGCLAGVNGGYFHADTKPIGLVVSEGRRLHGYERAKLLSGVLAVKEGQPRLLRSKEYSASQPLSDGLQAGPFLLDGGRSVPGLEATKQSRRTLVLTDGTGRYGLAMLDSPLTLAEAAELLANPDIVHELRIERALNLDGGTSSAFWARTRYSEFYLFEWKRARNFLCVLEAEHDRNRD